MTTIKKLDRKIKNLHKKWEGAKEHRLPSRTPEEALKNLKHLFKVGFDLSFAKLDRIIAKGNLKK